MANYSITVLEIGYGENVPRVFISEISEIRI